MNNLPYVFLLSILICYECTKINKRVSNAIIAEPDQFPFFAQVDLRKHRGEGSVEGICGATLIHPEWILTAAHCFPKSTKEVIKRKDVFVYVGGNRIFSPLAEIRWLVKVKKHPQYCRTCGFGEKTIRNDIAVCRLNRRYELNNTESKIAIVKLPESCATPCKYGKIVGIGYLNFHSTYVERGCYIRHWQVEVRDSRQNVTDTQFFSEEERNYGQTHPGDSGGPFLCYPDASVYRVAVQFGVVSKTLIRGNVIKTLYEDVQKHLNFIKGYVPDIIQSTSDHWQWRTVDTNPD